MEALTIILSILFIIFNVYLSIKINNWSFEKYNYKPFNLIIFSLMCLSAILILISMLILPEKSSLKILIRHVLEFNINKTELNSLVCLITGILIIIVTWIRVSLKTNLFIATYAIIIQLAAAIILIILVFFWFISRESKKAEKERNNEYRK